MKRAKRILYVQYTNPGAYPPLEHSSRILADDGWQVRFMGTGSHGAADKLAFPPHPNIAVRLRPFQPPGWRQKLHYVSFIVWCLACCATWRPNVVYCSDPWSTPIGVLIWYLFRVPVVYHEHDAPAAPTNLVLRWVNAARRRLAKVAAVCVVPQRDRLRQFQAELRPRRAVCVWNCSRRGEVAERRSNGRPTDVLNLFYVGNLNSSLLPEETIHALAEPDGDVRLHVVGYETIGSRGYVERLETIARKLGVLERFRFYGQLSRPDFFRVASACDVGLCLITPGERDLNCQYLFGASNKLFDYLACGIAVIVPNEREWTSQIVDRGYGVACEVATNGAIRSTLRELRTKPGALHRMGEAGRQRILANWNYETQFEPVRQLLERLSEKQSDICSGSKLHRRCSRSGPRINADSHGYDKTYSSYPFPSVTSAVATESNAR